MKAICNVHNRESGSATAYHCLSLEFCYASIVGYSGPVLTVEHISILCINVYNVFTDPEAPSTSGNSPTREVQDAITYPWEDIVGICAGHQGFMQLQLTFGSYDDMAQFMQAQRAALTKLDGRICLFNGRHPSRVVAIDFDTLRVLPGGTPVLIFFTRYHSSTEYWQSLQMHRVNTATFRVTGTSSICIC